jgi:hypothetical protein
VTQYRLQNLIGETSFASNLAQLCTTCFEQLTVFHARGTNLFAGTAAQAAIDMLTKSFRGVRESAFANRAH